MLKLRSSRSKIRIIERITPEQVTQLAVAHPNAEDIAKHVSLAYQLKSGWAQRAKPVDIWFFVGNITDNHLYQVRTYHKGSRHEIAITLSPLVPQEYRNAFQLYCLGLALENFNHHQGESWIVSDSKLHAQASQVSLNLIMLAEGERALFDMPWHRTAA